MEKYLLKKLVAATIIMLTFTYFLGFVNTCIGLFYLALTLFLAGLLYILFRAVKQAAQELKGGITRNEQ